MIHLTDDYEQQTRMGSIRVFDVFVSLNQIPALVKFFDEHGGQFEKKKLTKSEEESGKVQLRHGHKEMMKILVNRFNLIEMGMKLQSEKAEFLSNFRVEAITAIIYATEFCPKSLTLGEYAGLVASTYDRLGDSSLFIKRMYEITQLEGLVRSDKLGESRFKAIDTINDQIRLFLELLSCPLSHIDSDPGINSNSELKLGLLEGEEDAE